MITHRRSGDRGHANHGWLQTYHTFSFASYFAPNFMAYSVLRVLNQDRVAPGAGFGTHELDNMEIVSYVLDGVLEHKDSMGPGSRMTPGDGAAIEDHPEIRLEKGTGAEYVLWDLPAPPGNRGH